MNRLLMLMLNDCKERGIDTMIKQALLVIMLILITVKQAIQRRNNCCTTLTGKKLKNLWVFMGMILTWPLRNMAFSNTKCVNMARWVLFG